MTHTIRRQYLHLDLQGSEADGFALQNRLPELCDQWLRPAMERVLDRLAPATGHLCIERLEVDAGTVTLERLEQDLAEMVSRALEKALMEQMPPSAAPSREGSTDSATARLKTDRQAALEAFLYFLKNGRLPWSFRLPPGMGLERHLLGFWEKEPVSPSSVGLLAQTLRSPQARRRLVMQFSGAFLDMLLQSVSPQAHTSVNQIRAALREDGSSNAASPAALFFEKRLWETAFAQAASGGDTEAVAMAAAALAGVPEVVAPVLPMLKEVIGTSLPVFFRLLKEHAGAGFPAMAPHAEAQLKTAFGLASSEVRVLLGTKPPAPASQPASQEMASSFPKAPADKPATSVEEEGIYVDNAGLVILHPFLQMFFEGLGIARDGTLLEPDRALHLLHYLCTGHTPAPEYELTLPKILCNIPLDTPVEADITLTDREKDEAVNLLNAAIRWWEALRNTSPDALRGTFLCRPGKLSRRDDGDWLLQVEPQSFDILLAQLPWGISVVRLPWMEGMVWVEWG